MKLAAAVLTISLTPLTLFAQTGPINQDGQVQTGASWSITPSSNLSGCPISLRAQQVSSVDRMQIQNGQPKDVGQRLHLTLTNPDSKQIAGATVTVRGFTYKPRAMNAVLKPDESGSFHAARTISVTFAPGAGKAVTADILVPGVTAAQTIDLISLTYADGSGWKLAEGKSCRTAPDPLMLVNAR